jgi:hypothetical protein
MVLSVVPDDGSAAFTLRHNSLLFYDVYGCLAEGERLTFVDDGVPVCGQCPAGGYWCVASLGSLVYLGIFPV